MIWPNRPTLRTLYRLERWLRLLACLFVFGFLVVSFWLGPLVWHLMNPVDPQPPKWGSSSRYSTVEGFLAGSWIESADKSTARVHDKMLDYASSMYTAKLTFQTGHRFSLFELGNTVHGSWEAQGRDVILHPADVDGIDRAAVAARYEQWRNDPSDGRRRHFDWEAEGSALEIADRMGPIRLDADGARLYCPNSLNGEGTSFMGTRIWLREKGRR